MIYQKHWVIHRWEMRIREKIRSRHYVPVYLGLTCVLLILTVLMVVLLSLFHRWSRDIKTAQRGHMQSSCRGTRLPSLRGQGLAAEASILGFHCRHFLLQGHSSVSGMRSLPPATPAILQRPRPRQASHCQGQSFLFPTMALPMCCPGHWGQLKRESARHTLSKMYLR